jgi:hypothetical protein
VHGVRQYAVSRAQGTLRHTISSFSLPTQAVEGVNEEELQVDLGTIDVVYDADLTTVLKVRHCSCEIFQLINWSSC